jgi:hypothetical protein
VFFSQVVLFVKLIVFLSQLFGELLSHLLVPFVPFFQRDHLVFVSDDPAFASVNLVLVFLSLSI